MPTSATPTPNLPFLDAFRDPKSATADASDLWQHVRRSSVPVVSGSALLGLAIGLYGMSAPQALSSIVKVPLLLVATAVVCFPTFFVTQYAASPRPLSLAVALQLQVSALAMTALTWGVIALPLAVLLASAENYVVVKLLVTFAASTGGLSGAVLFVRGYRSAASDEGVEARYRSLVPYCVMFGLVGTQLAWNLRPFIGSPSQDFVLFRALGGNLIEHLLSAVTQ